MVRLKNRYLLVHILYPEPQEATAKIAASNALPDVVQFRRPSPEDLSAQVLARAIKEHVSQLYGDYGAGVTSGRLVGMSSHVLAILRFDCNTMADIVSSEIPLTSDFYRHCKMFS